MCECQPYEVDLQALKRFDERNTVFARKLWDESGIFYGKPEYRSTAPQRIAEGNPKYTHIGYARLMAAWDLPHILKQYQSWKKLSPDDEALFKLGQYPVDDSTRMSRDVKETAKLYGAALTGITEVNPLWVYSKDANGDAIEIPTEYRYAVVIAVAMDGQAVQTTPSYLAATATALGYGEMAYITIAMAQFIRNLGYRAIPMSNDTVLSIPLAIDAGLGQLGRNGLLITPQYGSRIRLCKLLTDLSLVPDQPIDFGLTEICRTCSQCAKACDAEAISYDQDPSYSIACVSNNLGIKRWAVNADRCYTFWQKNGASCSNCIAACPFTERSHSSLTPH